MTRCKFLLQGLIKYRLVYRQLINYKDKFCSFRRRKVLQLRHRIEFPRHVFLSPFVLVYSSDLYKKKDLDYCSYLNCAAPTQSGMVLC